MALIMPAPKPEFNAWPEVDAGKVPLSCWILVQYKLAKPMVGSIHLPDASRDDDQFKITAARVVAMGPTCFRNEATGELFAEAPWFKAGDFVRVPLTGGDQFDVESPHGMVRFGFWKDLHIKAIDTAEREEYERVWAPK